MKGEQSPTKPKGRPKKNSVPSLTDLQRLSVTDTADPEGKVKAGVSAGASAEAGVTDGDGDIGAGSEAETGADRPPQAQDCQVSTSQLEDGPEDIAEESDVTLTAEDMAG